MSSTREYSFSFWVRGGDPMSGFISDSRKKAEEIAARNGGQVVRRTLVNEDVGLRWEYDEDMLEWRLRDGSWTLAIISRHDHDGAPLDDGQFAVYGITSINSHQYDTLEAAKTAAETAVREAWI